MTRKKINKIGNINPVAWDLARKINPDEMSRKEIYNIFESEAGWCQDTVDRMLPSKYRAGGTYDRILCDLENMKPGWYAVSQIKGNGHWDGWFSLQGLYIAWTGLVLNGYVEYKIGPGSVPCIIWKKNPDQPKGRPGYLRPVGHYTDGTRTFKNLLWFRRTKKPYPKYLIHSKLGI